MSPQQIQRNNGAKDVKIDAEKCDIYAIGITLLQALIPFNQESILYLN